MRRVVVPSLLLGALVLAPAAPAAATPAAPPGVDYVLVEPQPRDLHRDASGPDYLYMNRCAAGCTVTPGGNSARTNTSSIPEAVTNLSAFTHGDETWDAVVACVRQTYAPYGVEIVTAEPTGDESYVEVMVAGAPAEMDLGATTLGIAPLAVDCSAQQNVLAFAFANVHSGRDLVVELCATVAHEAGHTYGLDHEFDCDDPMTYLVGCGQKFFLNVAAPCGEFDGPRTCRCTGATQNSHVKLSTELGTGTLPPGPTVSFSYPADGAIVQDGFSIFGLVLEPRVVKRVEFWINGWPWSIQNGSRTTESYTYTTGELPDGIMDVEVRAYNDLETAGSATITVTKGEPCASAATCLDGQLCEDGRCFYPAPTGVLGEECGIDADCVSRLCASDGVVGLCTERCLPSAADACAAGFTCLTTGADDGVCWPDDRIGGAEGCCSAGDGGPAPWVLGATLLLLGLRPRRRHGRQA